MRKLFPCLFLTAVFLISCQDSPAPIEDTATNDGSSSSPVIAEPEVTGTEETTNESPNATETNPSLYPEIGTPIELVQGDLLCYATIVDEQGEELRVGATFEICRDQDTILNKRVRFIYTLENVADCESAEPCGKIRQETVISDTVLLGENAEKLSNGEWTILVGNGESWDGTNNTGNLTYYGCDPQNNCLALTGGKVTCRDGVCSIGWQNGEYTYIIAQTITENAQDSTTTLRVRQGSEVILEADGFSSSPL